MPEEDKNNKEQDEQYELVFKNGALANLKELARAFGVPENDLGQVVNKGIQLLKITKNSKIIFFEDQNGSRYKVDLSKL